MKFIKTAFALIFVSFFATACTEAQKVEHIKNGIVSIVASKTEMNMFSNPPSLRNVESLGTGFFIKENYIVTCYHVIEQAEVIKVNAEHGNRPYEAELVFGDKLSDVAVIRIKEWSMFKAENKVTYLELADRNDDYSTKEVMTIGHPWGLFWSVSKGIISSDLRRPEANPRWFLQTDARVFPGNSGGPLLTLDGKVLGINALMFSKEGGSFGMVIPTPSFMKVINDLEKYNEVRWPSMGILMNNSGAVMQVNEDSPAQKAGIQVYDEIILVRSGEVVDSVNSADKLVAVVSTFDYQDKIELTVVRGGQEFILDLYPDYKLSDAFESKLGD